MYSAIEKLVSISWLTSMLVNNYNGVSFTTVNSQIGETHEGASQMDWMEQEQNVTSLSLHLPLQQLNGKTLDVNIIDTRTRGLHDRVQRSLRVWTVL